MTRNGSGRGWVSRPIVTWRSCIASSSALCTLAGARLISSARTRLAKIGPERHLELAQLLVVDPRADDVGRHQVGRELDALELDAQRVGERLHRQRLGQTGHALDEQVAAGQEGDDHPLEQHVLADDHPLHLVQHLLERQLGRSAAPGRRALIWQGAPAAPPAVPIGTANPIPTKSLAPSGLARPVTIPIT